MIVSQLMTDDEDNVLDLSVKKASSSLSDHHGNLSSLPSPPSSSTSSSSVIVSPKSNLSSSNKRMLETANSIKTHHPTHSGTMPSNNKRPLRFQCKHCDYKAPSTSLMQNHIYRHTDLTPYACAHCGHKSTTKSTIMVHIELCHPNMEVKIIENRVREQDFYCDLNNSEIGSITNANASISSTSNSTPLKQEPQAKKIRRSNQYDSESAPINGVAISLKNLDNEEEEEENENESSRASDEISETENLEPILFDDVDDPSNDPNIFDPPPTMAKPPLKFKLLSQPIPIVESSSSTSTSKDAESEGLFFIIVFLSNSFHVGVYFVLDGSEYLLVYNRPKQYYGSLYEPDKQ